MEPITEVKKYIENNLVDTKPGRRCVDGRYTDEEGTIARPGADAGYVLVLLNLKRQGKIKLSARECVDVVKQSVENMGGVFTFHTDSHGVIGCGHLDRAANPRAEEEYQGYGLEADDVKEAWKYMEELANTGQARELKLEGSHQERGVIKVMGKTRTIKPGDGQIMYFVYDETRDMEYIESLVTHMEISGVTLEDFITVSNQQTGATLHNLAKDKPVYVADTDNNKIEPRYAGKVS